MSAATTTTHSNDCQSLKSYLLKKSKIEKWHGDHRDTMTFSAPNQLEHSYGDGGCFGGSSSDFTGTFDVILGPVGSEHEGQPIVAFTILSYGYSATDCSDDFEAYAPGENVKHLYFDVKGIEEGTTRYENDAWRESLSAEKLEELKKAAQRAALPRNILSKFLQRKTFRFWHPRPHREGSILQFGDYTSTSPEDGCPTGIVSCITPTGKTTTTGKKKKRHYPEVQLRFGRWKIVDPELPSSAALFQSGGGEDVKANKSQQKMMEDRLTAARGTRCFLKVEWIREKVRAEMVEITGLAPPHYEYAQEELDRNGSFYKSEALKKPVVRCFYVCSEAQRLISIEDHGAEKALQLSQELDQAFPTTVAKDPRYILASRLIENDRAQIAPTSEDIAALKKAAGSSHVVKEAALLSQWTEDWEKIAAEKKEGDSQEPAEEFYHHMFGEWVKVPPSATAEQRSSEEGQDHEGGFNMNDQFRVHCYPPANVIDTDILASTATSTGGRALIKFQSDSNLVFPCVWQVVGGGAGTEENKEGGEASADYLPAAVIFTPDTQNLWEAPGYEEHITSYHRHPDSSPKRLKDGDKQLLAYVQSCIIGKKFVFVPGDTYIYNRLKKAE